VIIKGDPDYEFIEDGVIFRIFNHKNKFIVKAKCGELTVIQYGDKLIAALKSAKNRIQKMLKAPLL
jgi:hypothetical protein